jgi:hypothetical protein
MPAKEVVPIGTSEKVIIVDPTRYPTAVAAVLLGSDDDPPPDDVVPQPDTNTAAAISNANKPVLFIIIFSPPGDNYRAIQDLLQQEARAVMKNL